MTGKTPRHDRSTAKTGAGRMPEVYRADNRGLWVQRESGKVNTDEEIQGEANRDEKQVLKHVAGKFEGLGAVKVR